MASKKILTLSVFIFFTLVFSAYSFEESPFRGEVAFGAFLFSPSGSHSVSGTNTGTDLDLESDLGLSDDTSFFGRAKIEPGINMPGIYINASILKSDGAGKKSFTYGEQSFSNTASFDSKLTLEDYNLSLFYHLKGLTTATLGMVKLDMGGTIKWFNAEGKLTGGSAGSVNSSKSDYALAFYADLLVRPVERVELGIEWNGFSFTEASFSSLTGRFSYQVAGPFFVSVGYTTKKINMDHDGFKLDLDTNGTFLEGGYRF